MMWVENYQVFVCEWVVVYYDNLEEVLVEKLCCVIVVIVDEDYVIFVNSEGVILVVIVGGDYVCVCVWVVDYDFVILWMQFFDSLQQSMVYCIVFQFCFEVYFNDGNYDGYWDIDMYVFVECVVLQQFIFVLDKVFYIFGMFWVKKQL